MKHFWYFALLHAAIWWHGGGTLSRAQYDWFVSVTPDELRYLTH